MSLLCSCAGKAALCSDRQLKAAKMGDQAASSKLRFGFQAKPTQSKAKEPITISTILTASTESLNKNQSHGGPDRKDTRGHLAEPKKVTLSRNSAEEPALPNGKDARHSQAQRLAEHSLVNGLALDPSKLLSETTHHSKDCIPRPSKPSKGLRPKSSFASLGSTDPPQALPHDSLPQNSFTEVKADARNPNTKSSIKSFLSKTFSKEKAPEVEITKSDKNTSDDNHGWSTNHDSSNTLVAAVKVGNKQPVSKIKGGFGFKPRSSANMDSNAKAHPPLPSTGVSQHLLVMGDSSAVDAQSTVVNCTHSVSQENLSELTSAICSHSGSGHVTISIADASKLPKASGAMPCTKLLMNRQETYLNHSDIPINTTSSKCFSECSPNELCDAVTNCCGNIDRSEELDVSVSNMARRTRTLSALSSTSVDKPGLDRRKPTVEIGPLNSTKEPLQPAISKSQMDLTAKESDASTSYHVDVESYEAILAEVVSLRTSLSELQHFLIGKSEHEEMIREELTQKNEQIACLQKQLAKCCCNKNGYKALSTLPVHNELT